MNNICLTRCLVNGARRQGDYVVLNCTTQICTESGSPVNCNVSAYISEETYKSKRLQQIGLKPGACFKFSGKTVIDGEPTSAKISMMIDAPRFIEYPGKESKGYIKLFDIRSPAPPGIRRCKNRFEIISSYMNTKNGPARKAIVCVGLEYEKELAPNTGYNVSGSFLLRRVGENLMPVIYTETFVKDIVLDERIPVKIR